MNWEKEGRSVVVTNLSPIRINLMVAGIGGMGKSTFLKLFFQLYKHLSDRPDFTFANHQSGRTLTIGEVGHFTLQGTNLKIDVHLVDAPGYGDDLNNQDAITHIKNYLEAKHTAWTSMDTKQMTREEIDACDERIHCIFYFIPPHRMKKIDFQFIKQLSGLAPIVPIVAKADTMKHKERKDYLMEVRQYLKALQETTKHNILYDFKENPLAVEFLSEDEPSSPSTVETPAPLASAVPTPPSELNNSSLDMNYDATEDSFNPLECSVTGDGVISGDFGFESHHFNDDLPESSVNNSQHSTHSIPTVASPVHDIVEEIEPIRNMALPRIPNVFAVVCDLSENGLREYPWGTLEIYNKEHSDFRRLQELMFEADGTHLNHMRGLTEKMSIKLYQENLKQSKVMKFYPIYKLWKERLDWYLLFVVYSAGGLSLALLLLRSIVALVFR